MFASALMSPPCPPAQATSSIDPELVVVDLSEEPGPSQWACLDRKERERALRFHHPRDCRRYVVAHAELRRILGARLSLAPAAVRFTLGPQGKPFVDGPATCHFNLSHSGEVALIGVSGSVEIGVDIEVLRPVPDAHDMARSVFTAAERRELSSASAPDHAFLTGWTRKEACIKAIGSGLSLAPATFETGLMPQARPVHMPWEGRKETVRVQSVAVRAGLVAAVALRAPIAAR